MAGRPGTAGTKRTMRRAVPREPGEVLRLRRELAAIQVRARRPGSKATKATKTERVRLCVEIMARGEWVSGVTGQLVAEASGCAPETIASDAAEASRAVTGAVASQDELRGMVIATLQTIVKRTMTARKPQLRTSVEAIKALAGVTGIEAPKELNVGGSLAEIVQVLSGPAATRPKPD